MAYFYRASLLLILVLIPILGIELPVYSKQGSADNAPLSVTPSPSVENEGGRSSSVLQITTTPMVSPSSTSMPGETPILAPIVTGTPVIRLAIRTGPVLYAFIRAPSVPVASPFVILTAYRSVAIERPLEVRGRVDEVEFICPATPCKVPVSHNSKISFQAQDPFGGKSDTIQATVRVTNEEGGFSVMLEQVSQYFAHRDACSIPWGFDAEDIDTPWSAFPQQPELLATNKTLHYLAGQLIRAGIVDASDCPGKGIDQRGAPNLCGMERARSGMIDWQNMFDFDIWLAAKDLQIPPYILKFVIELESQFWPTNERSYVDEIGLGQINQLGIDVLLRTDPTLYNKICPSVLGDCSVPYPALSESLQKLIRGALLNSLNAYCPSCPHGIDLNVARNSISFIGLLLRANCRQVAQVMDLYDAEASYEDHWKFTLMSYHSGLSCVENAIEKLTNENQMTDWKHVARKTECRDGPEYVERAWASLTSFETARLRVDDNLFSGASPVFLPTPTPIPTIGPPPSSAELWGVVVLDENRDGVPEETEWVNGIQVTLTYPDGTERSVITSNGKAIFDLSGLPTGAIVTVSLPSLYRSTKVVVPRDGIVPVVFVFFPSPIDSNSSTSGSLP